MAMPTDDFYTHRPTGPRTAAASATFGAGRARGPVIDQDGREIPQEVLGGGRFGGFRFDFGHSSANPFANLTREQRLARLEGGAKAEAPKVGVVEAAHV